MQKFKLGFAVTVFAGFVGLVSGGAVADMAPSIEVAPQPAGKSVTVPSAYLEHGGFLVIHQIKEGKPVVPASIGHAMLKPGQNTSIVVPLSVATEAGDQLLAMLHTDTGKIGTYEFGPGSTDNDKPVIADGKPVVKPFPVK